MGFDNEIWKDIVGFEGLYQISNQGRVKSLQRFAKCRFGLRVVPETICKHSVNESGYAIIPLSRGNKSYGCRINRLVAQHFKPNPLELPEVNHMDGDKLNNNDWNLEWSTESDNRKHAYDTGLNTGRKGTGKVPDKVVQEIVASGLTVEELSAIHGLRQGHVRDIKARRIYKHVIINNENHF